MKKALIVYFSQGGTTKRIADEVATGLGRKGFLVDTFTIGDGQLPSISKYDLIGIGSPVYILRPPFIVTDYIKRLPELNGTPFFVFLLFGTIPGTAGNIMRKAMEQKGGREIGYHKFKGADYFIGYLQRGTFFSPNNPTDKDLNNATKFGEQIAVNLSRPEYIKPPKDPFPTVIHTFERITTMRFLTNQIYSRFFKVDKIKCTSCGICMKICPQKNITSDNNKMPIWGRNCLACFYCELKCPEEAIKSPVDWLLFAPLIMYNIYHGKKSPSIEHATVSFSNGKIKLHNKI